MCVASLHSHRRGRPRAEGAGVGAEEGVLGGRAAEQAPAGTSSPPALPQSVGPAAAHLASVSSVSLMSRGLGRVEMNPGREAFIQETSGSVCMDLE